MKSFNFTTDRLQGVSQWSKQRKAVARALPLVPQPTIPVIVEQRTSTAIADDAQVESIFN